VRVAPNMLLLPPNMAVYNAVYGFGGKFEKGQQVMFAGDPTDWKKARIFQARTETQHAELLRRVKPGFRDVESYGAERVARKVRAWIAGLKTDVSKSKGQVIDVVDSVKRLVSDAAEEVVLGHSHNVVEAGYDKFGKLKARDELTVISFGLPMWPALARLIAVPWVWKQISKPKFDAKTGDPVGFTALIQIVKSSVQGAKAGEPANLRERCVARGMLPVVGDGENKRFQSEEDLAAETVNAIFAGQGSTASAICSVLMWLARETEWQRRLREEVRTMGADEGMDIWNGAPMLQMFLRESMRVTPPFPNVFERVVATGAENAIPGVGFVPAGMRVGVSPYKILRSSDLWGSDAEVFKPERWEVKNDERKTLESQWIVFGGGSRACVGKSVALIILGQALKEFLETFDVRFAKGKREEGYVNTKDALELQYEKLELELTAIPKAT